jgi:hypothetical protein
MFSFMRKGADGKTEVWVFSLFLIYTLPKVIPAASGGFFVGGVC